jgi:microcystin-dependent protein
MPSRPSEFFHHSSEVAGVAQGDVVPHGEKAMTESYVGQILPFAFNFAPRSWATCSGQLLPIRQNTALFSLLGVNYGGDGKVTFGLPNMQGNVAIGSGQGSGLSSYVVGETGGSSGVTLTTSEIPMHTHTLNVTTAPAQSFTAAGNQLASGGGGKGGGDKALIYSPNPGKATTGLAPSAISPAGGNQAHNNMQPYVAVNFCICLAGNFPPRP